MSSKELEQAKERAFRLLSYRLRTEAEVSARLKKLGFSADVIFETIHFLKEYELIDDRVFAGEWVRYRLRDKKRSKRYLYKELLHKGVPVAIASEAVDSISDEQEYNIALEQARKRLQKGHSWPAVGRYLKRQGFPSWLICRIQRVLTTKPVDE